MRYKPMTTYDIVFEDDSEGRAIYPNQASLHYVRQDIEKVSALKVKALFATKENNTNE